jgi:hypothetical protein
VKFVLINKTLFYNAVMKFTGRDSYYYTTSDVNDTASEFGFYIKFSFRNEFKCEVLDEHKLFLSRIKYEF